MRTEIERSVGVLKGKALWRCLRAADMATFAFGDRRPSVDWRGNARVAGEWALHVQCAWRIIQNDRIVAGDSDLYYPADYRQGDIVPDEFDWDHDPNLRDQKLDKFFESGTRKLIVDSVDAGPAGSLQLALSDGFSLEVFPNDSVSGEYWRLFQPDKDSPHFVVTPRGIET